MTVKHLPNNDVQLRGYAVLYSLLLHGLVFGASLLSIQYVTWEPLPEPFRWEVTLVERSDLNRDRNLFPADDQNASLLENQTGLTHATQESAHNTETNVPTPRRTLPSAQVEVTPQQTPMPQIFAAARPKGLNQEVPVATKSDVPSKPEQSGQASLHSSIDGSSMLDKISSDVSPSVIDQEVPVTPPLPVSAEAILSSPIPSVLMSHTSPEPAHLPQSEQAAVHEPTESVGEGTTVRQGASSAPTSLAQPGAQDYGWLQHILSRKLDQLKRQSHPVLNRSGNVKVLIRLVILEGGDLGDVTVERSSGEDGIDQEAMKLVQRVFPLPLNQTLGRSQVIIRIPLSYSHSTD